jgi:hypothetical protein
MVAPLPLTDLPVARWKTLWILVVLAVCCCQSGCVQRRMTIRSNPPGALVYVDDYEIGTTPISADFIYYGRRKIRLVRDGYETLSVMQPVSPPWYQIPPLDFVTENLIPGEIRDQRTFHYQLTPQRVVPTEQLLSRAENLRRGIAPVGSLAPSPPIGAAGPSLAPSGPPIVPAPAAPEPIPTPEGVGGQPLYPLPPGRPAEGGR